MTDDDQLYRPKDLRDSLCKVEKSHILGLGETRWDGVVNKTSIIRRACQVLKRVGLPFVLYPITFCSYTMSQNRIDTHFHIVLPAFTAAVIAAGGDPSGRNVPVWTLESALAAMNKLGVSQGVLSHTSPGPAIAGNGEAGRKLARDLNVGTKEIVDASAGKFRWFASLPDWSDVEGTVAEAEWALKEAKADGVVVMTTYQDRLLGNPSFQPIWDTLNALKAIIFVHPCSVNIIPKFIADTVPQPLIDYPVATTRTAVDLVLTKTLATHPDVKIILSHAGGALPFLAERVLGLLDAFGMSEEEARRDMRRFWVDVALSTNKGQLQGLLAFTTPEKIIYGSDWPYVSSEGAKRFADLLDDFLEKEPEPRTLDGVNRRNAEKLFGW